jgi:hypothetical protein
VSDRHKNKYQVGVRAPGLTRETVAEATRRARAAGYTGLGEVTGILWAQIADGRLTLPKKVDCGRATA